MPVPIAIPSEPEGQPWPAPGLAAPPESAVAPRHTADVRFQADVLKHVTDAIIALDLDGSITYWNAGAELLHGLRTDDVLGRLLSDCVSYGIMPDPDEDLPATLISDARAAIRHAADGTGDLIYETPDGARRVVSVTTSSLFDEHGVERGMLAMVRDVSIQREMAAGLRHQALHDGLTGLPNRILFSARIERALDRGKPCAVLFVDLDRFKGVNDTLGHDAGDLLLTTIAARMQAVIEPAGVVARLGGDEFGVLVNGTDVDAREAAQRLVACITDPVDVGVRTISPRASIGVVLHAERYADSMAPLRDADIAMYEAKRLGQGHVAVFDQAMHVAATFRFGLEHDLRRAILGDELCLQFQPIVDLDEKRVVAFEALVRWEHPELGFLGPDRFVPLAEEIGIVQDLDRWVLVEAVRTLASWPEGARGLNMHVNCAVQTILQDDLPERVAEALAEHGVNPGSVSLELTERAFIDAAAARSALERLRDVGLSVCIDDFGTGYSSLALLHTLTVDSLKIDRSFVADIETSPAARAVVRAVVRLAADLGVRAVAEGVETTQQLALLRETGCQFAQGYLFARPLSPYQAAASVVARPWPSTRTELSSDTARP